MFFSSESFAFVVEKDHPLFCSFVSHICLFYIFRESSSSSRVEKDFSHLLLLLFFLPSSVSSRKVSSSASASQLGKKFSSLLLHSSYLLVSLLKNFLSLLALREILFCLPASLIASSSVSSEVTPPFSSC